MAKLFGGEILQLHLATTQNFGRLFFGMMSILFLI